MAGSGIRGQFEEKFKALIRDIEDEVCPLASPFLRIALFIISRRLGTSFVSSMKSVSALEIPSHSLLTARILLICRLIDTLFNLGKTEGSIDAGQMIKPALARGLQLVGATTRTSPL